MPQDSDGWQPLHPLSPVMRAGRMLILLMVVATQSFLTTLATGGLIVLVIALVAIVFSVAYGFLAWLSMRYRIEDATVELREGVISKTHKRIPLARVETVDVIRPVLARIFGLAEVRVEVAGSKDSEIRLMYLSDAQAVAVREQLLLQQRHETAGGVEREVFRPHVEEPLVAAASNTDVLLGYAAVSLGLPIALFFLVETVTAIFDAQLALGIFFASIATVLAFAFATAKSVEASWSFRLSETEGGFAIRRGLLNLLTQKVPLHRVQAVRVVTPLLWKPFGRSRLVVDIAGYGDESGDDQRTTSVLLPIGTPSKVRAILNKVFPELDLERVAFEPPPGKAKWRDPLFWRTYGVAWTADFALTKSGIFRRNIDIVPHRKIQSLRITKGPWQKHLGLATLHLDTAGRNVWSEAKHRNFKQAFELARASRAADR